VREKFKNLSFYEFLIFPSGLNKKVEVGKMAFDRQKIVEAVKEAKARAKPRNFTQTLEVAVNLRY